MFRKIKGLAYINRRFIISFRGKISSWDGNPASVGNVMNRSLEIPTVILTGDNGPEYPVNSSYRGQYPFFLDGRVLVCVCQGA